MTTPTRDQVVCTSRITFSAMWKDTHTITTTSPPPLPPAWIWSSLCFKYRWFLNQLSRSLINRITGNFANQSLPAFTVNKLSQGNTKTDKFINHSPKTSTCTCTRTFPENSIRGGNRDFLKLRGVSDSLQVVSWILGIVYYCYAPACI
jgi:hypothetical protein